MICKKCGAEAPENAVYCGMCGTRIDGKTACKSCGTLNDEKYTFCTNCGTRLDGKRVCENCGEPYQGNFCPYCGHGAITRKTPTVHTRSNQTSSNTMKKSQKIVGVVGGALGMLAVLVSLIFVFFIGVDVKVGTTGANATVESVTEVVNQLLGGKYNIFYYFGQVFEEIEAMGLQKDATIWDWQMNVAQNVLAIFGLVIGILALVSVVAFATVAIIVYVRNLLGYTEKTADGWVIACVTALLTAVGSFYALHLAKVKMTMASSGISISVNAAATLNKATVAAVVLVIIALALMTACNIFARGRYALKSRNLVKWIVALVGVGFSVTALCVVQNAGIALKLNEDSMAVKLTLGFASLSRSLLMVYSGMDAESYEPFVRNLDNALIYGSIAQLLSIVVLIATACTLAAHIKTLVCEKSSSGLVFSILAVVFAVALLVFTILCKNNAAELFELSEENTRKVGGLSTCITALVFTLLSLGVSIVQSIHKTREEKADIIAF